MIQSEPVRFLLDTARGRELAGTDAIWCSYPKSYIGDICVLITDILAADAVDAVLVAVDFDAKYGPAL